MKFLDGNIGLVGAHFHVPALPGSVSLGYEGLEIPNLDMNYPHKGQFIFLEQILFD